MIILHQYTYEKYAYRKSKSEIEAKRPPLDRHSVESNRLSNRLPDIDWT